MTMSTSAGPAPNTQLAAETGAVSNKNTLAKVLADINFLRERIAQIQSHRNPNTAVLHTYTSMLTRRQLVLALMQDGRQRNR